MRLQVSLSGLDRRIATLFVFWDVFNVFLGGMFAGSAFSQLGVIINKPGSIPTVIGTALPASSNFFINTLILKVGLSSKCQLIPQSYQSTLSSSAAWHKCMISKLKETSCNQALPALPVDMRYKATLLQTQTVAPVQRVRRLTGISVQMRYPLL